MKSSHDLDDEASKEIREGPHGWIQWKGTDVCIDLHCKCGHHGHIDDDFFYFYKCPKCEQYYVVSANVRLIPCDESIVTGGLHGVDCKDDE